MAQTVSDWLDKIAAPIRRWQADAPARRNRHLGTHCFYCGARFTGMGRRQRTIDHRHPRSQGGSDRSVNTVFACRACNERKADGAEADFLASEWLQDRRSHIAGETSDRTWPAPPGRDPAD